MFPLLRNSVVIIYLKRFAHLVFVASVLAIAFFVFYKSPLPDKQNIEREILESKPIQAELPAGQKAKEIDKKVANYEYKIKPLYSYEMTGLIVSEFDPDFLLNFSTEKDPGHMKDLCVTWGENINNGSYQKVKFSSKEFTCSFKSGVNEFSDSMLSNNHLIPADDTIAGTIKKTKVGDQVKFKGVLANYTIHLNGQQKFSRETNTLKDSPANGAYEIVYVTDFEIIKQHFTDRNEYIKKAEYVGLGSGIFSLLLFFLI